MSSKFIPLQLVQNIDLFEEIKHGVERNIIENHSQRLCTKVFFLWPQLTLGSAITCVLKKVNHCVEYKREDLLLSTGKSESYMNGQYVDLIQPSLLFGLYDRMSGVRLFVDWSCALCFGDSCSIHFARVQWCNCSSVVSNQREGCISLRRRHQGHS